MQKPSLGAGDVPIKLLKTDGVTEEELVLRPTFGAAQTLSRQHGGYMAVIEKLSRLDLDTIVMVVTLGLGYVYGGGGGTRKPPTDLQERIWRTGLTDDSGGLVERCITYIRSLSGGGRLPVNAEEEGTGEDTGNP